MRRSGLQWRGPSLFPFSQVGYPILNKPVVLWTAFARFFALIRYGCSYILFIQCICVVRPTSQGSLYLRLPGFGSLFLIYSVWSFPYELVSHGFYYLMTQFGTYVQFAIYCTWLIPWAFAKRVLPQSEVILNLHSLSCFSICPSASFIAFSLLWHGWSPLSYICWPLSALPHCGLHPWK